MRMLLTILLALNCITLVGCNKKDDKKSQEEMVNACLFDPTGKCQKKASKMALQSDPALRDKMMKKMMKDHPELRNGNLTQIGQLQMSPENQAMMQRLYGYAPPVLPPLPPSQIAIQSHHDQVMKDLANQENDPTSLYFKPPEPLRVYSDVEDAAPAAVEARQPASGGGSGDLGMAIREGD